MRISLVAASMLWLACSDSARPPAAPGPASPASPASSAPPARRAAKPAAPSAPDSRCAGELAPHREVLTRGRRTEIARGGFHATYHGRSLDDFDDGTTALVLSLDVDGQPWLPDFHDTIFHAFGEHCLRVVTSTDDRLELDVALQREHVYDSHRCHASCCRDHTPAPDGTIECCFCSDKPDP